MMENTKDKNIENKKVKDVGLETSSKVIIALTIAILSITILSLSVMFFSIVCKCFV